MGRRHCLERIMHFHHHLEEVALQIFKKAMTYACTIAQPTLGPEIVLARDNSPRLGPTSRRQLRHKTELRHSDISTDDHLRPRSPMNMEPRCSKHSRSVMLPEQQKQSTTTRHRNPEDQEEETSSRQSHQTRQSLRKPADSQETVHQEKKEQHSPRTPRFCQPRHQDSTA